MFAVQPQQGIAVAVTFGTIVAATSFVVGFVNIVFFWGIARLLSRLRAARRAAET
jgi:hypothetical protein